MMVLSWRDYHMLMKGYNEVEVEPVIKSLCYFEEWNKEIETPVSGLFEYYDLEKIKLIN